jgi:hypothetical protein
MNDELKKSCSVKVEHSYSPKQSEYAVAYMLVLHVARRLN